MLIYTHPFRPLTEGTPRFAGGVIGSLSGFGRFAVLDRMKKILIVAPAWIGDAVMAEPLYRRLHELYPGLTLDVLAPAWTRAVHDRMAVVNETIVNPFGHGELRLRDRWQLGRDLKARGYDQAIVLPNSLKSALPLFLAGIPKRTGWVGEMRYGLLNDARKLDKVAIPRMVERFSALAEPRGTLPATAPHPRLTIDEAARAAALAKHGLNRDTPIVAFCPGAEYGPAKRWPAQHVAALANRLSAQGVQVWIFGSGKDGEIADQIAALAPAAINLCGKTSLAEAIDLLSCATAAVTNDSGLMHVAAALGRPLVAVYGSSSPKFTPPLSDTARIVSLELECSPCFERTCPYQHMKCLNDLGPERVEAALVDLVPDLLRVDHGIS